MRDYPCPTGPAHGVFLHTEPPDRALLRHAPRFLSWHPHARLFSAHAAQHDRIDSEARTMPVGYSVRATHPACRWHPTPSGACTLTGLPAHS